MEFEFFTVFIFLFFYVMLLLISFTILLAILKKLNLLKFRYKRPPRWAVRLAKILNLIVFLLFLPMVIWFIGYISGDNTWLEFAYNSFYIELPLLIWFMTMRSFIFITIGADGTESGGIW